MIRPEDVAEAVRMLLRLSPGCVDPRDPLRAARRRAADPGLGRPDELVVAALGSAGVALGGLVLEPLAGALGVPAVAQPAEPEAPGVALPPGAGDRLVVGDRDAQVGPAPLGQDRCLEVGDEHAQLALGGQRARRAPVKRSHVRANVMKLVRPPWRWAASIGHIPPWRSVYAPAMITWSRTPSSIASRVRSGRQSMAYGGPGWRLGGCVA